MTEKTDQPDKRDQPEAEEDVEGHSMLMYEHARTVARESEREAQKHARDARILEDHKREKR